MKKELIAPCGMNCILCYGYQRDKNKCEGCNTKGEFIINGCKRCIIRNCITIKENKSGFCYECDKYPCRRLKDLDKRYRTKYHMSMLDNLEEIKKMGMDIFLKHQEEKWKCVFCGNVICVHHNICPKCNTQHIKE